MKTIFINLLLALSLVMTSCSTDHFNSSRSNDVFMRSFVPVYFSADEISINKTKAAVVDWYGFIVETNIGREYAFYSTESDLAKYNALCEKHNDMTFNRVVEDYRPFGEFLPYDDGYIGGSLYCFVGYPDIDFVSLHVVCNSDFDEQHRAGSSLDDITMVYFLSPRPYVQNGYVPFDWSTFDPAQQGVTYTLKGINPIYPVYKLVSELEVGDLSIIGSGYELQEALSTVLPTSACLLSAKFCQKPTLSNQQSITVTLTTDDGRVFSGTVQISWE